MQKNVQKYCKLKHQPIQKDKINNAKLKLELRQQFFSLLHFVNQIHDANHRG